MVEDQPHRTHLSTLRADAYSPWFRIIASSVSVAATGEWRPSPIRFPSHPLRFGVSASVYQTFPPA